MKPKTNDASMLARPAALFSAEMLERYLAVERCIAQQQSVSAELPALLEALQQQLEQLSQLAERNPALLPARALMQRVSFEILQHWARRAELGGALPAVARLLGRVSLFEPIPHERFRITQDWFFANVPEWQQLFAEIAGRPGLRALEIGSFEGMSCCWLLENVLSGAQSRIVCIDPFNAPGQLQAERYFDHNIAQTGRAHRVMKLKGYSKQALTLLEGSRFDIAYIDGSHHPFHALEDALAVWPLLSPAAIVIFDDYAIGENYPPELAKDNDPKPGIDAFLGLIGGQYRELKRGYQLAIQKL